MLSIAAEVLACAPRSRKRFSVLGALVTLTAHAALLLVLVKTRAAPMAPAPAPARPMRVESAPYVVELPPAAQVQRGNAHSQLGEPRHTATRPAVARSRAPVKPNPAPPTLPAPTATQDAPAAPAPPKQSDEAVDFTGSDGPTFTGATHGTPDAQPDDRAGTPHGSLHGGGALARTVGLAATEWHCPWPVQAEALDIQTQVVVLRAVVNNLGRAVHVSIVADPGYGFGDAAVVCAMNATFEPARDARGVAYAAASPPIRVTFTRPAK